MTTNTTTALVSADDTSTARVVVGEIVTTAPPAYVANAADIDIDHVLAGNLNAASMVQYRNAWTQYLAFARAGGLNPLDTTTLVNWRTHLVTVPYRITADGTPKLYTPKSINQRLTTVRSVMAKAAEHGLVQTDTAEAFDRVRGVSEKAMKDRQKPHARTRITPEQMRCILDCPDAGKLVGLRDRAMLAVLASSGVRVAEAVSLTVGHIAEVKNGKGTKYMLTGVMVKGQDEPQDKLLSVEAHTRIMQWLDARPVMSEYLFTQINTGTAGNVVEPTAEPITAVAAWKAVRKYASRCGVDNVKPHDLRRFVGTQLAKRNPRLAQKALGHKDINTTMRHYVLDDLSDDAGATDDLC